MKIIKPFPFLTVNETSLGFVSCSFENGTCGWEDVSVGQFQWMRGRNATENTGPSVDNTLGTELGKATHTNPSYMDFIYGIYSIQVWTPSIHRKSKFPLIVTTHQRAKQQECTFHLFTIFDHIFRIIKRCFGWYNKKFVTRVKEAEYGSEIFSSVSPFTIYMVAMVPVGSVSYSFYIPILVLFRLGLPWFEYLW